MDPISSTFLMFGLVMLLASWLYLIAVSFQDDFNWGLCSVFLPPLSYIYACFAWEKSKAVIYMAAIGIALVLFAL